MNKLLGSYDKRNLILSGTRECSTNCQNIPLLVDNYLSEFITKEDKEKVLHNLGILERLEYKQNVHWGEILGSIFDQKDLIEQLTKYIQKETNLNTASQQIEYKNSQLQNVTNIKQALDSIVERLKNMSYIELQGNITISPTVAEKGTTISSITCNWSYNKDITAQILNGQAIDSSLRSYTLNEDFTNNTDITLQATDDNTTIVLSGKLTFYYPLYYGTSVSMPTPVDLEKKLQGNRITSFTVNATSSEYIWFYLPHSYGQPTFTVNGFSGGFSLIDNLSYKGTQYDIWRSDEKGLGITTVNIS